MAKHREHDRERLTDELIASLEYPYDGERPSPSYMVYDLSVSGLGVRVYPSGRKTYVMRYMLGGRRRLITLAQCDYMDVESARRMARKVRDLVWVSAGNERPPDGYVLHHRNGDSADNRIENLELLSRGDHNAEHNRGRRRDSAGRFR